VAEPYLPQQTLIDAYGDGGFRFAGMAHNGAILCLPDGIRAWPVPTVGALTDAALALVFAQADNFDFFILGTGAQPWTVPDALRVHFRDRHMSLDAMMTAAAVRTYNVMLMESRRVGAGLIAV
jgi:uncharacterized protein